MIVYPDEAYNPVIDFYKTIPEGPLKDKANAALKGFEKKYKQGEAPPEEMLSSLKALVDRKEGGLEQAIGSDKKQSGKTTLGGLFNLTPRQSLAGLVAVLAGIAALSVGIPYVPLPVY